MDQDRRAPSNRQRRTRRDAHSLLRFQGERCGLYEVFNGRRWLRLGSAVEFVGVIVALNETDLLLPCLIEPLVNIETVAFHIGYINGSEAPPGGNSGA